MTARGDYPMVTGPDADAALDEIDRLREEVEVGGIFSVVSDIAVIRSGDRLLLTTPDRITNQQADDIKTRLKELMPDVTVVLVSGFTPIIQRADA
jgi:hypothetical protein